MLCSMLCNSDATVDVCLNKLLRFSRSNIVFASMRLPFRKEEAYPSNLSHNVIGKAEGLPQDASANVDHYLYGHPKQ